MRIFSLLSALVFIYGCGASGAGAPSNAASGGTLFGSEFKSIYYRPEQARLLATEDFESGKLSAVWTLKQTPDFNSFYLSGQRPFVSGIANTGSYSGHYFAKAGTDEGIPLLIGQSGITPATDEFYVEWYEFFQSGYPWGSTGQKLLRFTRSDNGARTGVELNLFAQTNNSNLQANMISLVDGRNIVLNTDKSVPENRWVKFAVWGKLNIPGVSDGLLAFWMDGNLMGAQEGFDIRDDRVPDWNEMWIGGAYSNRGPIGSDGHRYIDDIKVYNTRP